VNNLKGAELLADSKLVIPVSAASGERISYSRHPSRYKVHTGDTVLSVAEDFGVPADRLRRWNRLKGNALRAGRVLVVYKPLAPGEADRAPHSRRKKSVHHTTKSATNKASGPKSDASVAANTH
jgi:membrane-bound lytic murein transglycosylase D